MMMMNFGMVFLMTMLMGGISDVLDSIPTEEYWRIKNVRVTEASLKDDLAPPPAVGDLATLIDDLGEGDADVREAAAARIRGVGLGALPQLEKATTSDNPEIAARARKLITDLQNGDKARQVRLLMAIRTAGERKMKGLLPRLTELSGSKEMFVGDYAAAAVAAIEGKPYTRPNVAAGENAWKLPADVRTVIHVAIRGQKVATMEDLKKVPTFAMPGGKQDPEQTRQMLDQMMRKWVEIVEQTGNIRLDGVTVGLSGQVGDKKGFVVCMIHGQYDRAAVANVIRGVAGSKSTAIGGIDVVELEREFTLMFPSDRELLIIGGPTEAPKPLEAIAEAFKGNQQPLKQSPEMVKLLGTVDMKQPMWGAMHVSDDYRQAPLLASINTLTLSGKSDGDALDFRFDAAGQSEQGIREAIGMIDNGLGLLKAFLTQMEQVPEEQGMGETKELIKTGRKLAESIKVAPDPMDGKRAVMTGRLESPPQLLLTTFFGLASFSAPHGVPAPDAERAPAVRDEVRPDAPPPPR